MTSENVQKSRLKEHGAMQTEWPCWRQKAEEKQPSLQPRKWRFVWTQEDRAALRENLPLLLFMALVLFSTGTYFAYLLTQSKTTDDLLDYASYALPSLAAVAAGLNISFRREALWFWVSAILVFGGLVLYVFKNGMLGRGWAQFVYLAGIVAIIAMLIIVSKLQDGPWKSKSLVNPVFGWLTIIMVTIQCSLVIAIDRHPPPDTSAQQPLNDLQCHKVSGDLQSALVLSCTKKH